MIRPLLLIGAATIALAQAQPQPQTGQLDASETLFTVLAAINAAGYDAALDSNANSPVRKQLREFLASKKLESVEPLKTFFAKHRKKNWDAELSQYISFALSLEGPPDFRLRLLGAETPLDVRELEGLEQLVANFYGEAAIGDLWKRAQPAYDQMIASYHAGVSKALLESNAYLRNPTSGYRGRRFQIFVDLLGAPNQVQTRSYKDDYFVIVTPSPEPQIDQVRHAYLHYLLDPLSLRYFDQLTRLKGLAEYATPAPALEEAYKEDFLLFATECIIKAVESRLAHGAQKQALVDQALHEGFVLTPALSDGLAAYEKQEQSARLYFPDLIGLIDLDKEDRRLEKVHFAKEAAVKKAPPAPVPSEPALTGVQKTLADAEELYTKRDLDAARQAYLKILEQTTDHTLHAKAYYGLARIAVLKRDPELAEKLFEKILELSPDAETKSWTQLYLGRLSDAAGERDQAVEHYRAALAIDGAPDSVKKAAEKAIAQPFRKEK